MIDALLYRIVFVAARWSAVDTPSLLSKTRADPGGTEGQQVRHRRDRGHTEAEVNKGSQSTPGLSQAPPGRPPVRDSVRRTGSPQ